MLPPLEIVSVPVAFAFPPTVMPPSLDHVDPAPSTSATPVEPEPAPIVAAKSDTIPPSVMLSVPEPPCPTFIAPASWRFPAPDTDKVPTSPVSTPKSTSLAAAPLDRICAVPPLFICAVVLESGTPADQFAAVNQSPVASVHTVVWPKADAKAISSAGNTQKATLR